MIQVLKIKAWLVMKEAERVNEEIKLRDYAEYLKLKDDYSNLEDWQIQKMFNVSKRIKKWETQKSK